MPQRHVKRSSRLDTEGQAYQRSIERILTCCLSVKADNTPFAYCLYKGAEFIFVQYDPVVLFAQFGMFGEPVYEGFELELAKDLYESLFLGLPKPQIFYAHVEWHCAVYRYEFLAQKGLVLELLQVLPQGWFRNAVGVFEKILYGGKLLNERDGGFLSYTGDTGDII